MLFSNALVRNVYALKICKNRMQLQHLNTNTDCPVQGVIDYRLQSASFEHSWDIDIQPKWIWNTSRSMNVIFALHISCCPVSLTRHVVFVYIFHCNFLYKTQCFWSYRSTPSRWIIDQWDFPSRQQDTHWAERRIRGISKLFSNISKHPWCDNRQSLNGPSSIDHQSKPTQCATTALPTWK